MGSKEERKKKALRKPLVLGDKDVTIGSFDIPVVSTGAVMLPDDVVYSHEGLRPPLTDSRVVAITKAIVYAGGVVQRLSDKNTPLSLGDGSLTKTTYGVKNQLQTAGYFPQAFSNPDDANLEHEIAFLWGEKGGNQIFRSIQDFNKWLQAPNIDLNGSPPFVYLKSNIEVVAQLLGRLIHGVMA